MVETINKYFTHDPLLSRILPLDDTDACLAEGIHQCQEKERACRPWVASCGHQLLQLLLLFSLQGFLIHDVGRQRWAVAVCHCGFTKCLYQVCFELDEVFQKICKSLVTSASIASQTCPIVCNPSQLSFTLSLMVWLSSLSSLQWQLSCLTCKGLVYWAAVWSRE